MKINLVFFFCGIVICIATTFAIAQTTATKSNSLAAKKYVYAFVLEKYSNKKTSFLVIGNAVTPKTETEMKKAEYSQDALDIMGADGWELVAVTARDFQNGWVEEGIETTYYFKR